MTAPAKALRYAIQLASATALPVFVAAVAVIISAFITDLLRLGITASAYQRTASTPPFIVQLSIALLLGYALGGRVRSRPYALWVWVLPVAWMLFAVVVWHPTGDSTQSVWKYFLSGEWYRLPLTPTRSKWVTTQFTHTVPFYTSLAYAAGALMRRPSSSEQTSASKTLEVAR
jgi:hypothetical protein